MLACKSVAKTYGGKSVLDGVHLSIAPKDCLCIVGGSGSGKTTLMNLLLRREDPTSGSVEVDGVDLRNVPPPILQLYRRRMGIIFQEPMLLAHATVEENVALPMELLGAPPSLIKRNTDDLLKRLNLSDKAQLLPEALSLGEKTLVGIARSMIASPMIILADEPLANLDTAQTMIVVDMLNAMRKNGTTLILFSRHDDTAYPFKARVVELSEGKIAPRKTPTRRTVASTSAHKILEETEEKLKAPLPEDKAHEEPEDDDQKKNGGKKIRITSIGSGA